MKLSELKTALEGLDSLRFVLPDGKRVPAHVHLTELGLVEKHFMDCGGTVRREATVSLQLYTAFDVYHRLKPGKFQSIIQQSAKKLQLDDMEVEVEYQGPTIGKYGLDFDGRQFLLVAKQTDCLAKSECGIPGTAVIKKVMEKTPSSCCDGGSACC